jgi:hypothetical protein
MLRPVVLALAMAACSSPGGSPAPPLAVAACPVTRAFQRPPDEVIDWARAVGNSGRTREQEREATKSTNWAGGDGIWVVLPPDGVVTWGSPTNGSKFGLFVSGSGLVTATARRMGAPTPPGVAADIGTPEEGYGPPGFIASDVTFPADGCWKVTYRIAWRSLTFVVDVKRK